MSVALYTPAQVRSADARTIEAGTAEAELMERAAGHLARAIVRTGGRGYGLRVGIVCGKGHNGGDGLAAARRLLDAGAHPVVAVVGGAETLTGLPGKQAEWLRARGGRFVASPGEALSKADIGVDCLLGTGTTGAPRGEVATGVTALREAGIRVVACDQPTGVDAATGAVPGAAVRADLTVTIGLEKVGLRLWPARGQCGQVEVADIGIAGQAPDPPAGTLLTDVDAGALLPSHGEMVHKRSRGVVVVLAGSAGMSGAAVLAARGAQAAGAGLITVCTAEAARPIVATALPEVLTESVPVDAGAAFDVLVGQIARADALAVGPGLGQHPETVALIRRLVAEVEVPLVLDADGLNAFGDRPDELAHHRSPSLTLTPHAGEYARLASNDWGDRATGLAGDAARWGATVVGKGPGTMVASADGRVWVNATGSSALATGGTGDVLTGMLAALLAADPDPARVAAGVHLHGLAGEHAAAVGDARAVTAGDVADGVPAAWRRLRGPR